MSPANFPRSNHDLDGATVIFDLDGTLVDTAGDLAAAMNHVLALSGHAPAPLARVRHLVGRGARALIAGGFAEAGGWPPSPAELEGHVDEFLAHYMSHLTDHSRAFPGAIEAIEDLREAGAAIAICTNKREAWARALIEALDLSGLFEAIVGPDTMGIAKPDPAPVRRCLELTGARRGVFIGDSDTDLQAAAAANLPCLAALFGYGPLNLAPQAFASFSSYDQVPGLIRRALAGKKPA